MYNAEKADPQPPLFENPLELKAKTMSGSLCDRSIERVKGEVYKAQEGGRRSLDKEGRR